MVTIGLKKEVVCFVDREAYRFGTLQVVKQLIEFGAPISIDESREDCIEIHDDTFSCMYWAVSDQMVYRWGSDKTGRTTIRIKGDGPPEISTHLPD